MNEQRPTGSVRCCQRWPALGYSAIALATLTLLVLVAWRALLPESPTSATGEFTERDKREIVSLCRQHTARFALEKLRKGEFGWFIRSSRVLFQQKIDRFFDDGDGIYRAYV